MKTTDIFLLIASVALVTNSSQNYIKLPQRVTFEIVNMTKE